jgi:hypothetical protein
MKKSLIATLLWACAGVGHATVLTFDDVPGAVRNSYGAVGTYAGYTFGATAPENRMDWIDTVSEDYNRGAVSGNFTLVNNFGGAAVITKAGGGQFAFGGLWAETWLDWESQSGQVQGYRDGSLVWTSSVTLGGTFSHVGAVAGNIDELRLDFGDFFLVDNLELNEASAEVPLPGTPALMALGLAGLVLRRRSRR